MQDSYFYLLNCILSGPYLYFIEKLIQLFFKIMDKVKVNNQVVKMRKHVKRAKLFAINKFTKQCKQLQTKKCNDSQAEKNLRKVERLLEKIKILKKMMPDFVSKKAISKAKDWNDLLSQKNIPLEDQCLALLANDAEIQREVEKFHAEECQLVEKIPTLLLEWEVKNKMPKSPDKKKQAFAIKKQKLEKMAKRKISNFKGATFPNNVAVNKNVKATNIKKKMPPEYLKTEDIEVNKKKQSEKLEPMEDNSINNDQLGLEPSSDSNFDDSEDFFTKIKESEEFFVSKKQAVNNNLPDAQLPVDSQCPDISSDEEERDITKKSISPKIESAEGSSTYTESLILERLKSLANTDPRKLKAKNKSNSQSTKAIKVLDLKELQDSDLIPIQNLLNDSNELANSQTVVSKKDSFFLNGDKEIESSDDDDSNTNSYRDFRPKRKFLNFYQTERESKFKKNNFGDPARKSIHSFSRKDFHQSKNRFQTKIGKDFNPYEKRFQNKAKEFLNQNNNRVQKNKRGDFQFKNMKKFDEKSEKNSRQFQHFNSVKRSESFNQKRENKRSAVSNSFQSSEKAEKNVNLHPSWEAKNKLKEAAKSGFKGKRIVFDK